MKTLDHITNLKQLIEVAYNDMMAADRDPDYELDMDTWHEPAEDGTCAVCAAGAVMAKSMDTDILMGFNPSEFDIHTRFKLDLIDEIRIDAPSAIRDSLEFLNWTPLTERQEILIEDLDLQEGNLKQWKRLKEEI